MRALGRQTRATYSESYDEPGGTWLGLYEYHTQADTTWEHHFEGSALYDHGLGRTSSTRDVNNFLRTTHDVWEGSKLTQGYCTVSEEGVRISGEVGSITRTTEIHNQGEQSDWTNVLTRGCESGTRTGSSTSISSSTESPSVHSGNTSSDWQESVSSFGHTTTRTTHSSQVWSSQTGTRQSEWSDTIRYNGGDPIIMSSGSLTEAWTSPYTNVTITGTQPSGQPTPPTYTGLNDQHFDDLVDALLDHAQDLADQAQTATLTTASRAALVDAAIQSFNALDADPSGQNGGAVYQALATPPTGGSGGGTSGSGSSGSGSPGRSASYGPSARHQLDHARNSLGRPPRNLRALERAAQEQTQREAEAREARRRDETSNPPQRAPTPTTEEPWGPGKSFFGVLFAGFTGIGKALTYPLRLIPGTGDFWRERDELLQDVYDESHIGGTGWQTMSEVGSNAAAIALPAGILAKGRGAAAIDPNKVRHIFGNPSHKLGGLLQKLGSEAAAYQAVQRATQAAVTAAGITGRFEIVVTVGGIQVTVRGIVINRIAHIGTFFIP